MFNSVRLNFKNIIVIFLLSSSFIFAQHTFAVFNTTSITGGGSAYTKSLDVSGLSNDYLFYVVKADFVGGGNPAYSNTMNMELNNGGSTVYKTSSTANDGALANSNSTTLIWSGVMNEIYSGGGNLTIKFLDSFTDGSGPYTSTLNNVTVTIYEASLPVKSFAAFNTTSLTGGGSAYTKSLDVTGLSFDYLFYVITADFAGGGNPAYSNTMNMQLDNGGSTIYKDFATANVGALNNSNNTTLIWSGILSLGYSGGGNLTVEFKDTYNDGGGPYTSTLSNVQVNIYPSTIPTHSFASFNTTSITGGGSAYTKSLDVSGLSSDYLFYVVSADFTGGGNPAFSNTMNMKLTNGGSTVYKNSGTAGSGALANSNSTTLIWTGIMNQEYSGGGNLTIEFLDSFTDGSGPYTSTLSNVSVNIYPVPSATPVPVQLVSFSGESENGIVKLKWSTATEINNYGFEILRKSENQPWVNAGFVNGHGNSSSPNNYSFTDKPDDGLEFSYRLKQIDNDGNYKIYDAVVVTFEPKVGFELMDNYPNPFNPATAIKFYIPQNENVSLKIFDGLGREVNTLLSGWIEPGYHIIFWNGTDRFNNPAASGVYIYSLNAGNFFESKKMILLK